jgi:hypothetical protein
MPGSTAWQRTNTAVRSTAIVWFHCSVVVSTVVAA